MPPADPVSGQVPSPGELSPQTGNIHDPKKHAAVGKQMRININNKLDADPKLAQIRAELNDRIDRSVVIETEIADALDPVPGPTAERWRSRYLQKAGPGERRSKGNVQAVG